MSDTAFQTQYRQEFIAGFEAGSSLLRNAVTTEAVIKGNQAVFLVADSGGAEAVTRGVNGYIPGRPDNLTQNTCTLTEWHDRPERTSFNIFASQSDGKRIMQMTSMKVMNRKIDKTILAELANGTQDTGTAATASTILAKVMTAIAGLGNNAVANDGNLFAAVTPGFMMSLMTLQQFTNSQWVDRKPMPGNDGGFTDREGYVEWMGIKWITSNLLPGIGTSTASNFVFHRNAIGHAVNTGGIDTFVGYDGREDLSYCRVSAFMGSKLLQNSGVVNIQHDDTAYALS